VQNLPNQGTLPMGNCSDRLFMPQTWYRTAIDNLKDTSLGLYGGVGRLIENPPFGEPGFSTCTPFWRLHFRTPSAALLIGRWRWWLQFETDSGQAAIAVLRALEQRVARSRYMTIFNAQLILRNNQTIR
jgi:hypothetical protein